MKRSDEYIIEHMTKDFIDKDKQRIPLLWNGNMVTDYVIYQDKEYMKPIGAYII
jgi:hypothetical protein